MGADGRAAPIQRLDYLAKAVGLSELVPRCQEPALPPYCSKMTESLLAHAAGQRTDLKISHLRGATLAWSGFGQEGIR
jgi:hypothetical protein